MKKLFVLLIFVFTFGCQDKVIKKAAMLPDKITIYAADTGKDEIQAKSKALSFLADMRSGFLFTIENNEINVKVREVEINFIVGSKLLSKKTGDEKHVYFCKMTFSREMYKFKRYFKKTKKISNKNFFSNKIDFFKVVLKNLFVNLIKKNYKIKGIIYVTNISGLEEKTINQFLNITFSVFYKTL